MKRIIVVEKLKFITELKKGEKVKNIQDPVISSLDYSIFLSFFSFSYIGTYYSRFQLSTSDLIFVQKFPVEIESSLSMGYYSHYTLWAKLRLY